MKNKKNYHPISKCIKRKGSKLKTIGYYMPTNLTGLVQTCKAEIKYPTTKKQIGALILALLMFFGSFAYVSIY